MSWRVGPSIGKKIVADVDAIERLLSRLWMQLIGDRPEVVILDLDATDVVLHGDQQDKFYQGYYDAYCYLPLYRFAGQWLVSSLLRYAGQSASAGAVEPLRNAVDQLQKCWPATQMIVRADSGSRIHISGRECRRSDATEAVNRSKVSF